jgi:hypothetical protein
MNTNRKAALRASLVRARAEWERLLEEVGKSNLELSGVTGQWSIKDIIAHISAWESRPIKWFEAARTEGEPEPAAWGKDWTEEQTNDWIYQRNRGRDLQSVVEESLRLHDALVGYVDTTPEQDLFSPRAWLGGNSLADSLPGNSFEHVQDHTLTVREWWHARRMGTS